MGWVLAGPFAGMVLAQLGAEVIKVEPPAMDMARTIPRYFADGDASFYLAVNRGKRAVSIDLKNPRGMEVLHDLIRRSDAIIYNFAPNVPHRLGIDFPSLRKLNRRICVGQLIGFHDQGEWADTPSYDLIAQAAGGVMSITGEKDGEPVRVGYQIADLAGGLYLALSTVGALFKALRTGEGQQVQVSLFDCQLALLTWQAQNYLISGDVPQRNGSRHSTLAPSQLFTGSDGRYFVVAPTGDAFFAKLCAAIGRPELAKDARFAVTAERSKHIDELATELQKTFAERPTAQWLAILKEARVPAGPMNNVEEALAHPVTELRRMVETLVNPRTGNTWKFLGNPIKWENAPTLSYPPRFGEHTRSVLKEVCGYDSKKIEELARIGAVILGEER
jgi:CoA:oxalate CoA-transferase